MDSNIFSSIVPVLLIGSIGLIVGVVVGILISGLQKGSRPPESDLDGKKMTSALQVYRDPRSRKLAIEYDGSLHQSAVKLSASQKAALAEILGDLSLWIGLRPAAPTALQQQTEGEKTTAPLSAGDEPVLSKAEEQSVANLLAGAAVKIAEPVKEAPKTIAGQIDEILQSKLPQTDLRNRSIRLIELPERGMVVMVDGQAYEGVGDVPDQEVRGLIQSCVAEWEKSS